ncbi:hypothetical protein N7E81_12755 [Reichenbachiella carrageenanivorans]|uniref:Tetratricopeptide repeat-containing protein n=1 Tax=Reichenbachiella carrageenanivorans TaxID=2979869 RepID=A0ABY6CWE4_9BACT|nr:hypothetical protein [Reichenbachiella carrageenanivorans]UXX78227.1 hypothetical protein N7E81_12755 [Reichenbachiella carrageenanivorans]
MNKATSTLLTLALILLTHAGVLAQTENYKQGLSAIKNNRYHDAMISFTKVVSDEKYEISGKDLSLAYAYLAIIRTAYLNKDLENADFAQISNSQGHIEQCLQEMARAIQFQDNSTKPLIAESRKTLSSISLRALEIIGDSLLTYDESEPNNTSIYLANFAVKRFGELEKIIDDNWQMYDIFGLAYFHLGDMERSMAEFDKARTQFAKLESQPISQLHLKNYILSGNYFFSEKNDHKIAYKISNEGSAYTSVLINGLGDDQMTDILRLNKIENRFRQYMTRIDESGK